MEQRDCVIIGGGPAGYVGAIRAAQLGGKVTLIEEGALGGTCLNRGCIPTRALARGVEFVDLARKAKDYGVTFGAAEVDFAKMVARKDMVVKTIVGGVQLLMQANGIEVLTGRGRFLSPQEVEADLADGTKRQLTTKAAIIATGCRWEVPAVPGAEAIITPEQALNFKEIPSSLLILGDGDIAFTYATIFAKLGAAVTVAAGSAQILPGVDRELVGILEKELKKDKIRVLTEAALTSVAAGQAVVTAKGEKTDVPAQYVLLADSRTANVEGLGLEKIGVRLEDGRIAVNGKMETGVPGVFAAGDVTGGYLLAHVAVAEGKTAAENAMGQESEMSYTAVPRCIGTNPEIASVGLTEADAKVEGNELRVGRFSFGANGMATIMGERQGMVKMIAEAKYGQILGVHVIGPQAANLIPEAVLAMKLDATPFEIGTSIHAHPTLPEAMMEVALDVRGETLHSISANKR